MIIAHKLKRYFKNSQTASGVMWIIKMLIIINKDIFCFSKMAEKVVYFPSVMQTVHTHIVLNRAEF